MTIYTWTLFNLYFEAIAAHFAVKSFLEEDSLMIILSLQHRTITSDWVIAFIISDTLKAYLGLCLKNRTFKSKALVAKTSFLNFCQKCVLVIVRFFGSLKALLIFFYQMNTFFFKRIFCVKNTFKLFNAIPNKPIFS